MISLKENRNVPYTKVCFTCKIDKLASEFLLNHRNKDGLEHQCRTCKKTYDKRQNTKPEVILRKKGLYLLRTFGISSEQYDRMAQSQQHKCAICYQPETAKEHRTGKTRALSVDHNHITGEVRSLLCQKCNRKLGLYENNKKDGILDKYLDSHR